MNSIKRLSSIALFFCLLPIGMANAATPSDANYKNLQKEIAGLQKQTSDQFVKQQNNVNAQIKQLQAQMSAMNDAIQNQINALQKQVNNQMKTMQKTTQSQLMQLKSQIDKGKK